MTRRRRRRGQAWGAIGCALGLTVSASAGAAQTEDLSLAHPTPDAGGGAVLLDVPYVAQSEAMCGPAAVVMALRYWGDSAVRTEVFRPRLRLDGSGIETSVLERATAELGWTALAFRGDLETVVEHLRVGRPVVSLIEVGEDRYHYVTLVGLVDDEVVFHDPAVSPYQRLDRAAFEKVWSAGHFWSMLVLPADVALPGSAPAFETGSPAPAPSAALSPAAVGPSEPGPADDGRPCTTDVRRGVALARSGDARAAREALEGATRSCAGDAVAHRELAALHLREGRPDSAVLRARAAVALDASDRHALEILAAGHYLDGRELAALDVWNRLEPVLVREVTSGAPTRTRQTAILGAIGLPSGSVLTPDAVRLARRRLSALPAAISSRVDFTPPGVGSGPVVTAAVAERPAVPAPGPTALRGLVALLSDQRLELHSGSPSGAGELWTLAVRWGEHRRGLRVGLELPLRAPLPSVLELSGLLREEGYGFRDLATEERRRGEVRLASWVTPDVRVGASLAADRWIDAGTRLALGAGVGLLGLDDHAALDVEGEAWTGAGPGFHRLAAELELRTRLRREGLSARARFGGAYASEAAPRSIWPGAGIGTARPALARAHPLLDGGRIVGPLFGRGLAYAGIETVRWFPAGPVDLGVAAFVDAAWSGDRPDGIGGEPFQIDAGTGLRFGLGSGATGRIDLGRGLRDGSTALSVGVEITPR